MENIVEAVSQIDVEIARGKSFEAIEEAINESSMSEDAKACAWLYAWAALDGRSRRVMALGGLGIVR